MPYWQVIAMMAASLLGEGQADKKSIDAALAKADEILQASRRRSGLAA